MTIADTVMADTAMADTVVADMAKTELSAASELMQQHHAFVEDAEDEDLVKHESNTGGDAAGPEQANPTASKSKSGAAPLDTQSRELFPELSGSKSRATATGGVAPIWTKTGTGAKGGSGSATQDSPVVSEPVPRIPTPASGTNTPTGLGMPSISIPGRNVETLFLEPQHIMPRTQLKRPLPDIIKDLNRKSRANINMSTMGNGRLKFEATGPQDVAQQALNDLVHHIGTKQSIKVPIPQSARAHIIGKGGSTIKALQDKSRAKIQLPRVEDNQYLMDEDEDGVIDVLIEGNALSAAMARDAILKIVGERAANVSTRLRGIPAEFYPFLAGPKNCTVNNLEEANGVQICVPPHQAWSAQPPAKPAPGQRPVFSPAPAENHIQLAGDRAAVQAAKAEIERQVENLRLQLMLEQLEIQRGQHQFIIGDRGISTDEFFEDTGCILILPTDENDEIVTVIGPPDRLDAGTGRAMDLAGKVMCNNYDISRFHRQAPGGAAAHARNVTRYLRQKQEISRLERQFGVHLNTPCSENGALPWEIYSRDNKNVVLAKPEIKSLVEGLPPSRMVNVPVDPFFHQYIRTEVGPRVRRDYRVQLVVPDTGENGLPLLLVYEGPDSPTSYEVPRAQPTSAETQEMQTFLRDAREYLTTLLNQQEEIAIASLDVPIKFHDKLRRFIKREQESRRAAEQIPVRVSSIGQTVNLRGPRSAVESLATKCQAFIAQEEADEKERGFTMDFDFPQKYANHLIGKGGSHIRELKEKHDVEIRVRDAKVELQGPKAKAEACKSEILAFSRRLQDEATHSLKIEPRLHGSLIGPGGANINRLQTRYNVEIHFPHSNARDDSSSAEASDSGRPRRHHAPDEVTIRGPKKGAEAARDEILSLVAYLQENSHTAAVSVQRKQLPSLIGSGGTVMDQLRQTTGAKIDIPDKGDSTEGTVDIQVRGTKAQVAAAKKILEEKKAVFDNTVVKTIDVDRSYHKALIGSGGSNLRSMVVQAGGSDDRRELSRTIQFPRQESEDNTIKVEGPSEVVDKILAQIKSRVSEWAGQTTEILHVPMDKHRLLIGPGGRIRRDMETTFGVSIDVPRQGSNDKGIKIAGKPDDVEKAKAHIQSIVADQPGITIAVPRALHHAISDNGQLFRKLRSEFHVRVDHAGETAPPKPAAHTPTDGRANGQGSALPLITDDADAAADSYSWSVVSADQGETGETGDIPWVLQGSSADNIERAQKAIETALEQARQRNATGFLVLADPKTHRHVIGQGGSRVNEIRKKTGCRITVPKQGQGDSDEAIQVVGTPDGIEHAKELILEAVREGIAGGKGPKNQA